MENKSEKNETNINEIIKENPEIKKNLYKNIEEEEEEIIENNPILKEGKCNDQFIFQNYGKCASFINEIIQTEGITMYEHSKLKEIMRVIFN